MNERLTPSAEELRKVHTEKAAAVEFLGKVASNEGSSLYHLEDRNVPVGHDLVPGYRTDLEGEYTTSAPFEARSHLQSAAEDAQKDLDKSDAKAGKYVSRNLDKFIQEAQTHNNGVEQDPNQQKAA
jgi:hypothetical protein